MSLKKRLLKNSRLYLVLDKKTAGRKTIMEIAAAAISGGVDILQLRWKGGNTKDMLKAGKMLRRLTAKSNTLFIVDDDPILANAIDADGVHLGHKDISIKSGRGILGKDKIIGYSTHNVSQAKKAVSNGADYISIGPIFKTPIKARYEPTGVGILAELTQKINIPIFAIGGINPNNITKVLKGGIKRVAVVRAIVDAKKPDEAARLLKERLR